MGIVFWILNYGNKRPKKDKLKSNAVLKEKSTKKCMLEDCNNNNSIYDGPGSNTLCREHQLECVYMAVWVNRKTLDIL